MAGMGDMMRGRQAREVRGAGGRLTRVVLLVGLDVILAVLDHLGQDLAADVGQGDHLVGAHLWAGRRMGGGENGRN